MKNSINLSNMFFKVGHHANTNYSIILDNYIRKVLLVKQKSSSCVGLCCTIGNQTLENSVLHGFFEFSLTTLGYKITNKTSRR